MRLRYLEENRTELYTYLIMTEKLNEYLHDVDIRTIEQLYENVEGFARRNGTDEIKITDQIIIGFVQRTLF